MRDKRSTQQLQKCLGTKAVIMTSLSTYISASLTTAINNAKAVNTKLSDNRSELVDYIQDATDRMEAVITDAMEGGSKVYIDTPKISLLPMYKTTTTWMRSIFYSMLTNGDFVGSTSNAQKIMGLYYPETSIFRTSMDAIDLNIQSIVTSSCASIDSILKASFNKVYF